MFTVLYAMFTDKTLSLLMLKALRKHTRNFPRAFFFAVVIVVADFCSC